MTSSVWHRAFAIAAGAAVVVVAAGCSSSGVSGSNSGATTTDGGGSNSSSASTFTLPPTSTPTKSTVTIGAVLTESGPSGPNPDIRKVITKWVTFTNAHGGLNGHPVKVEMQDDGQDPSRANTIVKNYVADKVLAIFDESGADASFAEYAKTIKIPVICGRQSSIGFPCSSNPNFFPAGGSVLATVYGEPLAAKIGGGKAYGAVFCTESPACAQALPLAKAGAEAVGMKYSYGALASSSQPNYTAQCLALRSKGADAVFAVPGATGTKTRFYDDCARQNYKPIWVLGGATFNNAQLENPNLNGAIGNAGAYPWFLDQTEAQHEFAVAMGSDWPKFNGYVNPGMITNDWAGLQLLKAAAANLPANATSDDLYKGLYSLGSNVTLGGLIAPQTITQGKPTVNPCNYVIKIENKKFVAASDKPFCVKSSLLGGG